MSLPVSWDTTTSSEKSQMDIIGVLSRFGCSEFGFIRYDDGAVAVTFKHEGIPIRIKVDPARLVARVLKEKPYGSRTRGTRADYEAKVHTQAIRVTYRNLHDLLKVMLNQAESDLIDFKTLMLPFIVIGKTVVADSLLGNIDEILAGRIALPPAPDEPQDPYAVLGVGPDNSAEEIEEQYRKLIKKHHPDKARGSEKKTAAINAAYDQIKEERDD